MLLKDLFIFLPKSKNRASIGKKEGLYPFFTSTNVINKYVNKYDYDGEYLIIGDGGSGNCKYYNGKFSVSDHNYVLSPINKTNCKLVRYFLMKNNYKVLNDGFKGIGLKNISKAYIENINFSLNKNFDETKIIYLLSKIENSIHSKKIQLDFLDELEKSVFIEMFGDVLKNTKKYETCFFEDYVKQINIGPFGSDLKKSCFVTQKNSHCMVYEQKHAINKTINLKTRYLSEEKYNQLKRFTVGPGDIIVSCRGTIGKCYVLPKNAPHGVIHPSLMMIKPKENTNSEFLIHLLENILSRQIQQGSGVKMAIKAKDLSKIKTIKIKKIKQDDFVEFIHLIDKSKFIIQKEIELYQELFNKKLDEYFG